MEFLSNVVYQVNDVLVKEVGNNLSIGYPWYPQYIQLSPVSTSLEYTGIKKMIQDDVR